MSKNWPSKFAGKFAVVTMMAWTGCSPDKGPNTAVPSSEAPGTAPTIGTQASSSDQKLLTLSAEETKNYLVLFPGIPPTSKFFGAIEIADPKPGSTLKVVVAGREVFLAMPDDALPKSIIVAVFDSVETNNFGLSGVVQYKSLNLVASAMTVVCTPTGICATSPAVPTQTTFPVPSTGPTETCCACVYQDSEALGGCASKTEAACQLSGSGGCSWNSCEKVCYPTYKADCEGEPYAKFYVDQQTLGGACTRSNTMSSNVYKDWLNLPRGECKSMKVFYSGHGKFMATGLPNDLLEHYPGGDNVVKDTGCSGLAPGNGDEAFRSGLCNQLKAAGVSGSVTTTGQQTEVRTHEELTSKIIKISWTPGDAACKEDISYGSCAESRKDCDETKASPPTPSYYFCNTGNGIIKKTCSCSYYFGGRFGGCSYN